MHNKDLIKDLSQFTQPSHAFKFFKQFDSVFGVFSKSVKKIYTDYRSTLLHSRKKSTLIVEPNFADYSSIYSHVNVEAVTETDLFVYVKEYQNQKVTVLSGVCKGKRQSFVFSKGIRLLSKGYFDEGSFIPVISLYELKEQTNSDTPAYLRLYKLDLDELSGHSQFDKRNLGRSLNTRLNIGTAKIPNPLSQH